MLIITSEDGRMAIVPIVSRLWGHLVTESINCPQMLTAQSLQKEQEVKEEE